MLISGFLKKLASWKYEYDAVVLIALAGKDNILNWIPGSILLYDVVDHRSCDSFYALEEEK